MTPASEMALFADLYELTMLRAYHALDMTDRAVFSLFVRRLPDSRNYLLACGLDDVLDQLSQLRFGTVAIGHLAGLGPFPPDFLEWLAGFRFTGDVWAVPEGTPVFANEPLLEVEAPIAEAQLVETLIMNQIGVQTLLASKGARVATAAAGRRVIDFGTRRAQGVDAAIKGARAFFIAGIDATSNVLAGQHYGLPVAGTMAHSFVEACDTEDEAFRGFATLFPGTTLLVDTYDTIAAVRRIAEAAARGGPEAGIGAIRIDSGDLGVLAGETRRILDEAGLTAVKIVVSGGLDEHDVAALVAAGAPIDAFGVGTAMSVSADAPSLDLAYKLVSYAGRPRMKLSPGKLSLPGPKQVFRRTGGNIVCGDVIGRRDEMLPGTPLLAPVMRGGERLRPSLPLAQIRDHAKRQIAQLPSALSSLVPAPAYPVEISAALAADERHLREQLQTGPA
jgi:nicotinate phosphoribosyltransferase